MAQPPSDNVWIGDLPVDIQTSTLNEIFGAYGTVSDCRVLTPKQPGQKASGMVRFGSVAEAQWVVENLNGNIAQGLEEPIIARFANAGGASAKGGKPKGGGGPYGGDGGWGGGGGSGDAWNTDGGGKSSGWGLGGKDGGWGSGGKDGGWAKGGKDRGWGSGDGGWGKGDKGGSKGFGKKGSAVASSFEQIFQHAKKTGVLGGGRVPPECTVYVKNLPSDTVDESLYKLFAPFGAIAPTGVKAMMQADGTCKGFGFIDFVDADAAAASCLTLNGMTLPDGTSIAVSQKLPSPKQMAPAMAITNASAEESTDASGDAGWEGAGPSW